MFEFFLIFIFFVFCFFLKLTTSEYVHLRDPNYSNFCTIKSCTFAGHNYMCTGSDDWNIYVWKMPTDWSG
jgi:hypothetical protein